MRIDHGSAEVRVEGWIPVDARVEAWTDDAGADLAAELASGGRSCWTSPGFRLGPDAGVTIQVARDAGPAGAHGRGARLAIPHHVRLAITLGGPAAKYRGLPGERPGGDGRSARAAQQPASRRSAGARRAWPPSSWPRPRGSAARGGRTDPASGIPHRQHRWTSGHNRPARRQALGLRGDLRRRSRAATAASSCTSNRGESLSLQYHHQKDETIALVSRAGRAGYRGRRRSTCAGSPWPGTSVHVTAGVLHRVRAVEEALLVEASSAAPGWREDVVRIADRYGRTGNSGP